MRLPEVRCEEALTDGTPQEPHRILGPPCLCAVGRVRVPRLADVAKLALPALRAVARPGVHLPGRVMGGARVEAAAVLPARIESQLRTRREPRRAADWPGREQQQVQARERHVQRQHVDVGAGGLAR